MIGRWMVAGAVTSLAAVAASPLAAQSLRDRIARAGDGPVVFRYATRADVCGDGRDAIARGDVLSVYPSMLSVGRWSGVTCRPGPARVRLTMDGGRVVGVRASVGAAEMPTHAPDVTDLGTVPAADAAAFLLDVARRGEGRAARDAILPAAIADSTATWRTLVEIARDESRPREVRRRSLFWTVVADEPEARRAVRGIAEDRSVDTELRGEALFTLGHMDPSDEDERWLRALYTRLESRALQEKLIAGLGAGHSPENHRWLLDSIVSREEEAIDLRKSALFWAAQGEDGAPIDEIVRVYPRLKEQQLKEHYVFVLSQRHEDAAVTALIDMARRDPDPEVRHKAYFWLGQSGDPRAKRFLMEAIDR